ncbi:ompA family protein [Psychrobacter sp. AntiMn-1]|uniref:OmpA family protein n=1 Tax=Psychrobacter sp. AntiMn-1 TaxID=1720344 RepID=UPI0008A70B3E|nr:OmpA family protein [Psychrobacter sp. AntiMn-1]AOY44965.1 ompA family protein [Psychrobacter sp. AntiMn-1]
MTSKVYLAMGIFSSIFTLSACQAALQSVTANQQAPIVAPVVPAVLDSDGDGVLGDIDECPQTPLHTVVDDRGCPFTLIGVGLKMEYRAFFAKDSSELSKEYQLDLDKVAEQMNKYDTATMKIEAHISKDEMGQALSALSKNRAMMVKNYLILKHDIKPSRLSTFDCGIRAPIASADTEEGKSMNRRVYGLATEPKINAYNDPVDSASKICDEF